LDYKEKLDKFNSTEKYNLEMNFFIAMMHIKRDQSVLDYGCGTGWMQSQVIRQTGANMVGYDINMADYINDIMFPKNYCNHLPDQVFDHVYMMHSLAHIAEVGQALRDIKKYMHAKSKIHVMTPNALWLDNMQESEYTPDDTVIEHYSPNGLRSLFESYGFTLIYQGGYGQDTNGQFERLFISCETTE